MPTDKQTTGSALASGAGWALVLFFAGGPVLEFYANGVDALMQQARQWGESLYHSTIFGAGAWFLRVLGVVFGLLAVGVWQILLFLAMALGHLVKAADHAHILPLLGFLFGLSSRALSGGFGRIGAAAGATAAVFGVSFLEIFTARRWSNKLWALSPFLIAAAIIGYAHYGLGVGRKAQASEGAPGEMIERYWPDASWKNECGADRLPCFAQLRYVELSRDRLTCRMIFYNRGFESTRFRLTKPPFITTASRLDSDMNPIPSLTREHIVSTGNDRMLKPEDWVTLSGVRTENADRMEIEYHFPRPKNPYRRWHLVVWPVDERLRYWWWNDKNPWFTFDLTKRTKPYDGDPGD